MNAHYIEIEFGRKIHVQYFLQLLPTQFILNLIHSPRVQMRLMCEKRDSGRYK